MAATAPSHSPWTAIIRQQNSLHRQMEHKIRLLMELQRERRELEVEAVYEPPLATENGGAGSTDRGAGAGRSRDRGRDARATSDAENAENCGNELKDLLQTQGISENTPVKRTAFDAPKEAISGGADIVFGVSHPRAV